MSQGNQGTQIETFPPHELNFGEAHSELIDGDIMNRAQSAKLQAVNNVKPVGAAPPAPPAPVQGQGGRRRSHRRKRSSHRKSHRKSHHKRKSHRRKSHRRKTHRR